MKKTKGKLFPLINQLDCIHVTTPKMKNKSLDEESFTRSSRRKSFTRSSKHAISTKSSDLVVTGNLRISESLTN